MSNPSEAFDAIAAEVAKDLRGVKIHPRDVYALCELIPASKRTGIVKTLRKGTEAQAKDENRDSRRVDPTVLIYTVDLKHLLQEAKPYLAAEPKLSATPAEATDDLPPKIEAAPGTEA